MLNFSWSDNEGGIPAGSTFSYWVILPLVVCFAIGEQHTFAQSTEPSPDPRRFITWAKQDAGAFAVGLVSRYVVYAGTSMGVVLVTFSGQDDDLTRGAVRLSHNIPSQVRTVANEIGNVKVVKPMSLMLFLGSLASKNYRFQDAAFTSFEAILLSNIITDVVKGISGRARPYQEQGAQHFRPFSGNTSFPSGHATTVFAFTTPYLLYYRNALSIAFFALGAGTAFIRIADEAHWFSDVVVGSGIGFLTGYWLTKRHMRQQTRIDVVPIMDRDQVGLSIRFRP